MPDMSLGSLSGLQKLATTQLAGFPLQDATPGILTYTFPNDGNQHRVVIVGSVMVATLEVGGAISGEIVPPGGGAAALPGFLAANQAAGNHVGITGGICGPGTTVQVAQTSALTSGAATAWAEIWGS